MNNAQDNNFVKSKRAFFNKADAAALNFKLKMPGTVAIATKHKLAFQTNNNLHLRRRSYPNGGTIPFIQHRCWSLRCG